MREALVGRSPADDINFQEQMVADGADPRTKNFLWGNPAFLLAQRITNAFSLYKWTAAIRGVEGGGLVEGLPAINFLTKEGDVAFKCPVEVSITDRREKELSDLGFIALVHRKNTDQAAFFGGATTQKPKVYQDPKATANARLSCSLPYILAASRFAHYIKVIMRDKVGSFMTRENVEKFLNTWIADYVLLNDNASQTSKAQYPLREARVDVSEIPGKPGCYNATVYLRPHFQLEELTASIRLVAELPPPAAV
jgi:type VI secretion system protein ImpC